MNMSGSHLSKEFFDLVKAIGESRSKQEEDRIVVNEIAVLKQRLNESNVSPKKMKEYLVRTVYVEMLGHDASFSYIHAVKLAHEKQLLCKRTGYLACNLFLHKDHELMLLLINTIQRDLSSPNHLDVSAALTCVCRLVNEEMQPAIFPLVKRLLTHRNEVVRKKACMALHKLHAIQPESLVEVKDPIRRSLCDPDPSVMGSSLHVLHELAKANVAACKDLVPSLVSILKQVCEHRLPRDYDYHRMPAPWIQVKLLSMLSTLGNADKKTSEQMYETLYEVVRRADAGVNVGYAIIYECVKTITNIYPSHGLLELAASSISRFIGADNHNLKYVGVTGLGWIVQVNAMYASQHQLVVVDCLEDPDETLKRKTLDLLYQMTNPKNVTVVVDKLSFHLKTSVDQHLRRDLASKITHLAERYAPSNHWYLDAMTTVLELAGSLVEAETAYNLTTLIAEGPVGDVEKDEEFRRYAVDKYVKLCEEGHALPDTLAQIVSWVLGEYGTLCSITGYTDPNDIIDLLCDSMDRSYEDSSTRGWILTAIMKLCAGCVDSATTTARTLGEALSCSGAVRATLQRFKNSQNTCLQQKCYELELMLEQTPQAAKYVLPFDASSEDIRVDRNIPFLDTFVQQALTDGARAYVPADQRQSATQEDSLGGVTSHTEPAPPTLKFAAYEVPSKGPALPSLPATASAEAAGGAALRPEAPGATDHRGGDKEALGFQVQGPRRWGPSGYASSSAPPAPTESALPPSSRPPPPPFGSVPPSSSSSSLGPTQQVCSFASSPGDPQTSIHPPQPPPPSAPRELTEREKTAAALFSGLGGAAPTAAVGATRPEGAAALVAADQGRRRSVEEAVVSTSDSRASCSKDATTLLGVASLGVVVASEKKTDSPKEEGVDLLDFDSPISGSAKDTTDAAKDTTVDILSLDVGSSDHQTARPTSSTRNTVLEPYVINTAQVGSMWGTLSLESKGSMALPSGTSCEALMARLRDLLSVHIVEVIGVEGIAAGRLPQEPQGAVFIHCKVTDGNRADVIVKTASEQVSQNVLNVCLSRLAS
eukprot:GHVS01087943.1.p1 GENE.GHVS01087943.1~~GHVS01087943.1.p1  ORF type:complete len:1048 (-),score=161.32 GHVS01087943.1:328-3471(-)